MLFECLAKGPIICPKCKSNNNISSSGWRPGLHRVLTGQGQFYVLSFGYQCTGCPEHTNRKSVKGESTCNGCPSPPPTSCASGSNST